VLCPPAGYNKKKKKRRRKKKRKRKIPVKMTVQTDMKSWPRKFTSFAPEQARSGGHFRGVEQGRVTAD
jgi:hypothetical protein